MKILFTNDDGIMAPGLLALVEAFSPSYELAVVAPENERSGASQSITLRGGLEIRKNPLPGHEDITAWAISGTPADCVRAATGNLISWWPDILISGINRGSNTGLDSRYSGTVAAALEGASLSIPSFALSLDSSSHSAGFKTAANIFLKLFPDILKLLSTSRIALNINFPDPGEKRIKGIKITRMSRYWYRNRLDVKNDEKGQVLHFITGEKTGIEDNTEFDCAAVKAGYISITPLSLDFTGYDEIPFLKSLEGEEKYVG